MQQPQTVRAIFTPLRKRRFTTFFPQSPAAATGCFYPFLSAHRVLALDSKQTRALIGRFLSVCSVRRGERVLPATEAHAVLGYWVTESLVATPTGCCCPFLVLPSVTDSQGSLLGNFLGKAAWAAVSNHPFLPADRWGRLGTLSLPTLAAENVHRYGRYQNCP